jgi:hypothetical protein
MLKRWMTEDLKEGELAKSRHRAGAGAEKVKTFRPKRNARQKIKSTMM